MSWTRWAYNHSEPIKPIFTQVLQTNFKKTLLYVPLKNTSQYGTNSITSRSMFNWNDINQKKIKCSLEISRTNFITLLKRYFFQKYIFFMLQVKNSISHKPTHTVNKLIKHKSCSLWQLNNTTESLLTKHTN